MRLAVFESATTIVCSAPWGVAVGSHAVEASTDGGATFSSGGAPFVAYDSRAAPTATAVTPGWASTAGGAAVVVRGANLAPTAALGCQFDEVGSVPGTLINATAVRCESPAATPRTTLLHLTTDGECPATASIHIHDHHLYSTHRLLHRRLSPLE